MKLISKIFLLIILSFNISNISFGSDIHFVNMEKVIYESNPGKLVVANLEEINKGILTTLKNLENEINVEEKNILNDKENFSDEVFNKKIQELKKKISFYKTEKNQKIKNFDKLKKQKVDSLIKKFIPIIEDYMKEKNISFLIDKKNIFIANKKYDITDNIITLINKKFEND